MQRAPTCAQEQQPARKEYVLRRLAKRENCTGLSGCNMCDMVRPTPAANSALVIVGGWESGRCQLDRFQ
jgi:hypothetical protein